MGSFFTPAIVCSSSKDGMAAVAADSSIEAGRDRSANATPIRATNTIAEIIMRFMVILRQVVVLSGQIEHSIRQTFAAPSRLLLAPGSGVGVAQHIDYMIESIEMF
jgi:hypothetical protein